MRCFLTIVLGCIIFASYSQADSLHHKKSPLRLYHDSTSSLGGTRIVEKEDTASTHKIELGGYVSTYYAYYDDESSTGEFVKFPTICPRNKQIGLNMAMINMSYKNKLMRSNIAFHYGDIPQSSWPSEFNLIQEANAGIKLYKGLWLDAGFFKTHIGIESFQPRENITSSMSIVGFFEPYYLSGAKLTYQAGQKLTLQTGVFNGYNTYIESNKNKMLTFSALYDFSDHFSMTYNFLTCDESPSGSKIKHQRFFHNLYGSIKYNKLDVGFEINYGAQQNTLKKDSTKQAHMFSGLLVMEYRLLKRWSVYAREEYYSDPDQILCTGYNMGKYITGTTLGFEFKPFKTAALSIESRALNSENLIFRQGNQWTNLRMEFITCLDVWF